MYNVTIARTFSHNVNIARGLFRICIVTVYVTHGPIVTLYMIHLVTHGF